MIKSLVKKYLYTSGLEEEQYDSIEKYIYEENRIKLNVFSFLGIIFLGVLFLVSIMADILVTNRTIYTIAMIVLTLFFFVSRFCKDEKRHWITIVVYLFMTFLFWVGIQISVVITPDERAVSLIVLIMSGPIVFHDRPIRMIGYIGISAIISIIAVLQIKTGSVLETDLINIVFYSMFSMTASTYMTVMKYERYFKEQELKRVGQTDALTGLYNRNAFTEYTDRYEKEKMPENFTIIYFDINGLKGANDILGHDAGDELIQAAANCIRDIFGENGTCYRTGGDEFIVITEQEEQEVLQLCRLFDEKTANWRGKKVEKLHVSYGKASVKEFPQADYLTIQRIADERLYQNKREFYSIKENDRRRR